MTFLQTTINQVIHDPSMLGFDKISSQLLIRFFIDFISVFILIRVIYYKNYKRTDLFLTFFGFNSIIFLITYLLNQVEMSMGAAFGLFAVFSMLRYRTEGISTKDMTYLFITIALGLITAISNGSLAELGLMNAILLGFTAILESNILIQKEQTKGIIYDKINLITPDKKQELIDDLRQRTGLNIQRVEINHYDFLKDSCQLTIFYFKQ